MRSRPICLALWLAVSASGLRASAPNPTQCIIRAKADRSVWVKMPEAAWKKTGIDLRGLVGSLYLRSNGDGTVDRPTFFDRRIDLARPKASVNGFTFYLVETNPDMNGVIPNASMNYLLVINDQYGWTLVGFVGSHLYAPVGTAAGTVEIPYLANVTYNPKTDRTSESYSSILISVENEKIKWNESPCKKPTGRARF